MLVGVVGHHRRIDAIRQLSRTVSADHVEIDQGDPVDPADGCDRAAANHIAVLEWMWRKTKTGWCVVLEDDAQPVPAFRQELDAALHHTPSLLVGLYLGTGNPSGPVQRAIQPAHLRAQAWHAGWITADFFTASVAYAVHRSVLGDMLIAIQNQTAELPLRITRWSQAAGVPTAYTHPSLCNHDDRDSVVYPQGAEQTNRLPRRAWAYGRRGAAPAWNTRIVAMEGHCPPWSRYDGCPACVKAWEAYGWPTPQEVS